MTRAVLSILLTCLATTAFAEVTSDLWYTTTIDGKRVGHLHERKVRETVDRRRVIRTDLATRFALDRMGTEISIQSRASFVELPTGEAISFDSNNKLAANDYSIRAERQGQTFLVTQSAMGKDTETEVRYEPDILFPHAIEMAIKNRAMEPGAVLQVRTFSPDLPRPSRITIKCKGWETVELLDGEKRRLLRFESTQDLVPGVVLTEWRDREAVVHKTELPILGVTITSTLTTKERALLDVERVEMMLSTLVDPHELIPQPRRVSRAVYELVTDVLDLHLPQDHLQKILKRDGQIMTVETRREDWAGDDTAAQPGPEYLQATPVLQIDDPSVRDLAELAGRKGSDDRVAKGISRWVYTSIDKKSLSVGFATASEVARNLTGDCTEHAVLAAALARARGLPSKVAVGLVYLNGRFGYHMWTEVFVDGWHAIDPSFGQEAIDATHIKLGESSLAEGFVDPALIGLVQLIANLEIRVLEYKIGERTYASGAATAAGHIREGSYRNPLYGLRVRSVPDWKLVPRNPDLNRSVLVRMRGPAGARGELSATTIGYDFRIETYISQLAPNARIVSQTAISVGKRPGRRFILETDGRRHGVVAFFDREMLYSVRIDPLKKAAESALTQLIDAIEISTP